MELKPLLSTNVFIFMAALFIILFSCHYAMAGEQIMNTHSEPTVVKIHYHRFDGQYDGWNLWTWNIAHDGHSVNIELKPAGNDEFGPFFLMDLKKYPDVAGYGILPRLGDWKKKDDPNRILNKADLKSNEIYIISGKKELFFKKPDITPFIKSAFLDSSCEVVISFPAPLNLKTASHLKAEFCDVTNSKNYEIKEIKPFIIESESTRSVRVLKLILNEPVKISGDKVIPDFEVKVTGYQKCGVRPREILNTKEFYYDGELGCILSYNKTMFRVFSPLAKKMNVIIYKTHDGKDYDEYEMDLIGSGVWETSVNENLSGSYYNIKALVEGSENIVIDPYALCNTAHNGRSLIIDRNDRAEICNSPVFDINKAVIYEMHVRDFTIDNRTNIVHKGKYAGVIEENRTYNYGNSIVSVGMDHLKELGINTVQIMPVQDFENNENSDEYNWGYMPVHYNSPDGWYASNTNDASRVDELRRMVDGFHKNGIKVIMDVVYNHTAETSESTKYSFNGLVPGYYYRTHVDGEYYNGSGCGNEFKSDSLMGRKFIIDSLKYWISDYKIDGYRFDLMGLIDAETMKLAAIELRKIKPDVFIYGEPWTAGACGIEPFIKGCQKGLGISVFNDIFRDAIKGSVWNNDGGYVQGTTGAEIVARGLIGSIDDFAACSSESLNYCEAHDNRTLYDMLIETTKYDKTMTLDRIKKMHMLSTLLVFTAQGVPFIHSGQEFMRTKNGEDNSYNKPDSINKIDWERKIEYNDVYKFNREMIKMRKEHELFHMNNPALIRASVKIWGRDCKRHVPEKCLAFEIKSGALKDEWKKAVVIVNPNHKPEKFSLPHEKYEVFMYDFKLGEDIAANERESIFHDINKHELNLPEISAAILYIKK